MLREKIFLSKIKEFEAFTPRENLGLMGRGDQNSLRKKLLLIEADSKRQESHWDGMYDVLTTSINQLQNDTANLSFESRPSQMNIVLENRESPNRV